MADSPKDVAKRAFDALAEGRGRDWFAELADDVVWLSMPETPFPRETRGKAAIRENLLGPLMERLAEPPRLVIDEYVADGDRVIALARGTAPVRGGGSYDQDYAFILRVRDGKIVEIDERLNTAVVNRAFGRS